MKTILSTTLKFLIIICCLTSCISFGELENTDFRRQSFLDTRLGFATEDEPDRSSFCIGADYNYRISEYALGGPLYLGLGAAYHTSKFSSGSFDDTESYVGVGPVIENTSILSEKFAITQAAGYYLGWGKRDFGSSEEDLSINQLHFDVGFRYQFNESLGLNFNVPVFQNVKRTYEDDLGNETELKNTSFNFFKNRSPTIGLSFTF